MIDYSSRAYRAPESFGLTTNDFTVSDSVVGTTTSNAVYYNAAALR